MYSLKGFFSCVGRKTNDGLFSEKGSGGLDGHVVLADVHAISLNSKSDVEAVVNQERHFILFTSVVRKVSLTAPPVHHGRILT